MTLHYLTPDLADDAAAAEIKITEIEVNDDDCMTMDQWAAFMLDARNLRRRDLFGVELFDGTDASGRMFKAVVVGERVLVKFADFAPCAGATGIAANETRPER